VRGHLNKGQFRVKHKTETVEEAGREGEAQRATARTPPRPARSPLSGVSVTAYDKAKARATRAVARAASRGARHLQRFAAKAQDDLRSLIGHLKAAGHSPLKGGLGEAVGFLYALLVLKSRLAREALERAGQGAGGGEIRQAPEAQQAPKVEGPLEWDPSWGKGEITF
jgi:hypothetical protein